MTTECGQRSHRRFISEGVIPKDGGGTLTMLKQHIEGLISPVLKGQITFDH